MERYKYSKLKKKKNLKIKMAPLRLDLERYLTPFHIQICFFPNHLP